MLHPGLSRLGGGRAASGIHRAQAACPGRSLHRAAAAAAFFASLQDLPLVQLARRQRLG
jgi:hypothetical protein